MRFALLVTLILSSALAGCQSGKPTLVGKWADDSGAVTEFTADGHINADDFHGTYVLLDPQHMEVTANGQTAELTVALVGDTVSLRFIAAKDGRPMPKDLTALNTMHRVSH